MPDQDEIDRIVKESTQVKAQDQDKTSLAKETKKGESKLSRNAPESVGVLEGEEPNPNNPFHNFLDISEVKIQETMQTPAGRETAARANMLAKINEINASGNFTKEEAERIKKGLDPARAAEVDAQILIEAEGEEKTKMMNDIQEDIAELVANPNLGRNEKREQLRSLRQNIQSIEAQMDSGRA